MVGYGQQISLLEWKTGQTMCLAEVDQNMQTRMNDGKCDSKGRLWFGNAIRQMSFILPFKFSCLHVRHAYIHVKSEKRLRFFRFHLPVRFSFTLKF